jgi:hypothetical protein
MHSVAENGSTTRRSRLVTARYRLCRALERELRKLVIATVFGIPAVDPVGGISLQKPFVTGTLRFALIRSTGLVRQA